jgi:hypothetical protein
MACTSGLRRSSMFQTCLMMICCPCSWSFFLSILDLFSAWNSTRFVQAN